MNFFDLHCDTVYKCIKDQVSFNDNALDVTADKASFFENWYQCFAVFIKDGIQQPFDYYRNAVSFLKNEFNHRAKNLTPILTVEGGALIENDLSRINTMHVDGIRAVTLTWNAENQIAGGADSDAPLKDFGIAVIKELNKFDIMVDLAHLNKKSFYSALELADKPIITHTCLESVNMHRRNVDDHQIKALIEKKGIIGICFYPLFLGEGDVFENIYKNVYHMLELGFEDNLSIGSDFDGCIMSEKLADISMLPSLYDYLKSRNITEEILNKIFFKNAYNFFNN